MVDCRLSETRDMDGAKQFVQQAVETVGHPPDRVTTDGHDSYPRAIRATLGDDVVHRTNPYLNNRLEHDHRGGCPLGETAVLSDAGVRQCRFSSIVLPSV